VVAFGCAVGAVAASSPDGDDSSTTAELLPSIQLAEIKNRVIVKAIRERTGVFFISDHLHFGDYQMDKVTHLRGFIIRIIQVARVYKLASNTL
jgi:hypothetical protein